MVYDGPDVGDRLYYTYNLDDITEAASSGDWVVLMYADEDFTNRGGDMVYKIGPTVNLNPRYMAGWERV